MEVRDQADRRVRATLLPLSLGSVSGHHSRDVAQLHVLSALAEGGEASRHRCAIKTCLSLAHKVALHVIVRLGRVSPTLLVSAMHSSESDLLLMLVFSGPGCEPR